MPTGSLHFAEFLHHLKLGCKRLVMMMSKMISSNGITPCVCTGRPVMFTGEMVFPWMFDDFAGLRPYKVRVHLPASKVPDEQA
jgi:hypothetical protein